MRISASKQATEAILFHVEYCKTLLGLSALNLLGFSYLSPYWFMLPARKFAAAPEIRILGPWSIWEGHDRVELKSLIDSKSLPFRKKYDIKKRQEKVCSAISSPETLTSGAMTDEDCGRDCADIRDLGMVRIACGESFPIPIPPADRVVHGSPLPFPVESSPVAHTPRNMLLHMGCKRQDDYFDEVCPVGYRYCPRVASLGRTCDSEGHPYQEQVCCVDQHKIGDPLYNVTEPPTYLQVYGYMQHKVQHLKIGGVSDTEEEIGEKDEWCSVASFRCNTLRKFAENGDTAQQLMAASAFMLLVAFLVGLSRFRRKLLLLECVLYLVAGGLLLFGIKNYKNRTLDTLVDAMTLADPWGRLHVHPFFFSNLKEPGENALSDGLRDIGRDPQKDSPGQTEWLYYHLNARVDFASSQQDEKGDPAEELITDWGYRLGLLSGCLALCSGASCVELFFAQRQQHPLQRIFSLLAWVVCLGPCAIRRFIDNYLAPYPVLFVYPWQRLYDRCFTCGTWLPQPFDLLYDCGLMLPVHMIRAIWDYVSCQDICSKQEKKVLRKVGVSNDRLQSLLCSRRSYFVMMAGMGILGFIVKLQSVVEISQKSMLLRQAASQEISYPIYRCEILHGDCALGAVPDVYSMASYMSHMALRVYAVVEEGCCVGETMKALIEWAGGFVSICCACGALANWTSFRTSRRFCLLGWLFMMLTPVLTCAIREQSWVDRGVVEKAVVRTATEMWDEMDIFVHSHPCEYAINQTQWAVDWGRSICQISILGWMVKSIKQPCQDFLEQSENFQVLDLKGNNYTEQCQLMLDYVRDALPDTKATAERKVREEFVPDFMDTLQLGIGIRMGLGNIMRIVPAMCTMVPGLMQGGLMFKNVVPRQTMPSILTTLPWAFTTMFWSQYQVYYQILSGKLFLVAALAMSLGPLVYYVYGKIYKVVQPMCDQQSITITFRLWYYALIFAMVIPYSLMLKYILWFNDYQKELVYESTIGWLFNPTAKDILILISGTLASYAYTLQAGIDWFVDEIVDHHICAHAPCVLVNSRSREEADRLQERLGTTLDLDSVEDGSYVCGGLGDDKKLTPPAKDAGDWSFKIKVYASSLENKDLATLDAFSAHIRGEEKIPIVLSRARRPYRALMENPPRDCFIWDDAKAVEAEARQAKGIQEAGADPSPPVPAAQVSVELTAMGSSAAASSGGPVPSSSFVGNGWGNSAAPPAQVSFVHSQAGAPLLQQQQQQYPVPQQFTSSMPMMGQMQFGSMPQGTLPPGMQPPYGTAPGRF